MVAFGSSVAEMVCCSSERRSERRSGREKSDAFNECVALKLSLIREQELLNDSGFLESNVCAVLVDCFDRLSCKLDAEITIEFRNEDTLCLEVRGHGTFHGLGHVTTDTTFFLCEARAMDSATHAYFGTCNATYFCHNFENLVAGAEINSWKRSGQANCGDEL